MTISLDEIKSKAPKGATHYSITIKGDTRYYTKNINDEWGIYQDWKYPIGWKVLGIFFDSSNLKPLN